jgi:ribosomal protein S25
MQQFISLSALLAVASAYSYGGNYGAIRGIRGGRMAGIGLINTGLVNTGYVNSGLVNTGYVNSGLVGLNSGYVGGYTLGSAAVAPLAVQTSHQVQYADVPSGGQINPISVEIDANPIPINMLFRSASSQLNVQQAHQGAAGSAQESSSEDEAHILRHSVTKPVLQEVREVITPFRRITQEIQPVREEINTIVARGVNQAVVNQGVVGVSRIQGLNQGLIGVNQGLVGVNQGLVGVSQGLVGVNSGLVGVRNIGLVGGRRLMGNTVQY